MSHQDQYAEHRIVVLGAGYTGMLTALRLARRARRSGVRVTLVNPSARFTERLRLHQLAAGQQLAGHRVPDLLAGTGVAFVEGTASALDPQARTVTVDVHVDAGAGAVVLPYDTLVYALGSGPDTARVPGADAHAHTLGGRDAALALAGRLRALAGAGDGTVAVCGAGLTGVEAATEIAETYPALTVTLIGTDEPGAVMGGPARAHVRRALDRLGVSVRTGAAVTKVLPDGVELATGEVVAADVCLWTTGVRAPRLAADAGIAVDEAGRIVTDRTLRSVSHPEVYAVGDAAAVRMPWGPLHGTCQSGMPTAQYAADTIARRLRGRPVKPFRFGYVHQPVSLGRHDAVIQFTHPDDTPRRGYLRGRVAVLYKETVSSSPLPAYWLVKRADVNVSLFKGGRATR